MRKKKVIISKASKGQKAMDLMPTDHAPLERKSFKVHPNEVDDTQKKVSHTAESVKVIIKAYMTEQSQKQRQFLRQQRQFLRQQRQLGDSPGGQVVKNPPSNARDMGSNPGWGTKIPHVVGQL